MPTVTMYVRKASDEEYKSYEEVGKAELPMPRPQVGETIHYDGNEYKVENVIHNIDRATIEIIVSPERALYGRNYYDDLNP